MDFSNKTCEYCEVMSIPCDGIQDCSNCIDCGVTCGFPCDSDTDNASSGSSFPPGWETFYVRQARILILYTKCDNLATYLPLIRGMWARTSHRVKELYWDDEAGRMEFAKRSWNSPIPTMRGVALYAAHQFQKDPEAVKPDECFWRKVHCGWKGERGDVQEFWEDMSRDRMAHKRAIRVISVIPSPQPALNYTVGRTIYTTTNDPTYSHKYSAPVVDMDLFPSPEDEFAHLFDTNPEALNGHFGPIGVNSADWSRGYT